MDDNKTKAMLAQDTKVFLHQAMSTPGLDALVAAGGIYLQDAGQRYMDFHGNNVHQLGYGHPHVLVKGQAEAGTYYLC